MVWQGYGSGEDFTFKIEIRSHHETIEIDCEIGDGRGLESSDDMTVRQLSTEEKTEAEKTTYLFIHC